MRCSRLATPPRLETTALADACTSKATLPPRTPPQPKLRPLDPGLLARAEAALQALQREFSGWMTEETGKLEAARARIHAESGAADAWNELLNRAHDLKGLGTTFGHPTATCVCASLCRLLDDPAHRAATSLALMDAHVDAVRALADNTIDERGPEGAALCEALEARTDEALASRAG